ncbi:MAG TPA: RDD family protein, partial [Gemmatimonadales bacterium]|nr:RDD family protein [Gemmatimonadales bacterium]
AAMSNGDGDAMKGMAMAGVFGAIAGMIIAAAVVGTIYFLIEGFTGWTLGKLLLGIQVGNQDGTRASMGQLLARYALKNCNYILKILAVATGVRILATLGSLGALAILIGCFFVLGSSKQAFHDMIAKTAVYPRAQLQGS